MESRLILQEKVKNKAEVNLEDMLQKSFCETLIGE